MITTNKFNDLSKSQKEMLPNEEAIKFFKEKGWYISDVILPNELIDNAVKGASDYYNGLIDFKLKSYKGIASDKYDVKSAIRNNEFVTLQKKELQLLGLNIMVTATAAKLAETKSLRLFADSLVNKFPEKKESKGVVGWHSDKAYWPTCSSDNMLTAWIPLQDCTIDMGLLTHIDGSHKWKNDVFLKNFYSFNNQNLSQFEKYLSKKKKNHEKTPMVLKKGQVSFHNCHTIHCSYPNVSNQNRLALAVHFQDENNCYQECFDNNGNRVKIGYDHICNKDSSGNPDYSDKDLFPLVYTL